MTPDELKKIERDPGAYANTAKVRELAAALRAALLEKASSMELRDAAILEVKTSRRVAFETIERLEAESLALRKAVEAYLEILATNSTTLPYGPVNEAREALRAAVGKKEGA